MCDPITALAATALGAAGSLFGGGGSDAPKPPPPVIPPPPPDAARTPGADVKVGDGVDPTARTTTPQYGSFAEKRVFGKSLGGLGKGGLGL